MQTLSGATLGFIGGGNMAEAMFSGLLSAGRTGPGRILVADVNADRLAALERAYGVKTVQADNDGLARCARQSDILVLAVKPQHAAAVLPAVSAGLRPDGQLVVSILGGVTLETLERALPGAAVVRAMPNTALKVRAGATGLAAGSLAEAGHVELALELFGALGGAWKLDESMLDPLTGVSGCGPAYAYLFIEALADGGVAAGLPRELAVKLAAQTLAGAGKMALESGRHPGQLKDDVCSPGGATIAGVRVLESSGFRGAVMNAVTGAVERMREVGRQSG